MARYIDADELYKEVTEKYRDITAGQYPFNIVAFDMAQLVKNAPAADVVPKSKVKQVKWERDVAIKQLEEIGLSFGEKTDGYGNLTEYAREIFKEIEKISDACVERGLVQGAWFNKSKFDKRLAELKKKYTEEGK